MQYFLGGTPFSGFGLPTIGFARVDSQTGAVTDLPSVGDVFAITVTSTNRLIIGGGFSGVGSGNATHIAAWNPTLGNWVPIPNTLNGPVYALSPAATGGAVFVGGGFTQAGTIPIARFGRLSNTNSWTAIASTSLTGQGLSNPVAVHSIAPAANGDFLVAGRFETAGSVTLNNVARLVFTQWTPLGAGVTLAPSTTSAVREIAEASNGDIIVAGEFNNASGVAVNNVARFRPSTGAWSALGSGITGFELTVRDMLVRNGDDIWIGGKFTTAGGVAASGLARWNNSSDSWTPAPPGISDVHALTPMPGDRILIGARSTALNGVALQGTVIWSPQGVSSLTPGINGIVNALHTLPSGDVVAGGSFTQFGSLAAGRIAVWNTAANTIRTLGTGFDRDVLAIEGVGNGTIYAGGRFTLANGQPATGVARWNQADQTWSPLGNGLSGDVHSLLVMPDGELVAGGFVFASGQTQLNNIAAWNGSAWQPMGAGLNGTVFALEALPNGQLVAGGAFTSSQGTTVNRVARWDGFAWQPLGSGFDDWVYALTTTPAGELLAGGRFSSTGSVPVQRIAAWNGTAWRSLNYPSTGPVRSITQAPDGTFLVASERGTSSDGLRVRRWNGLFWFDALAELSDSVFAIRTTTGGDVIVGGPFDTTIEGSRVAFIALYATPTECPLFCDSIDFNNDQSLFDPVDVDAFLSVYSEGPCIPANAVCNDIDFNNDDASFDPCDITSFLMVFSEGPCEPCAP